MSVSLVHSFPLFQRGLLFSGGLSLLFCVSSAQISRADSAACSNAATVLLVIGAPGESEYATNFLKEASLWQKACVQGEIRCLTIGRDSDAGTNDGVLLQQALLAQVKEGPDPLWLVLIGHGSFDGKEARFNLRGPDVSSSDLATWLKPFHRPLAIVDTSSSSGPFLAKLSATNRVVITATRSGHEQNYTRFGQYMAEVLLDPAADLDKDGQVSLLEAFLSAARRTAEFYKSEGRIVTEHALLDDNGDGQGTPADWFQGLRVVRKPKDNARVDGLLARQFCLIPGEADRKLTVEQRARRDQLERSVLLFREKKSQMPEDEYYRRLETLLLELARFSVTSSVSFETPQGK